MEKPQSLVPYFSSSKSHPEEVVDITGASEQTMTIKPSRKRKSHTLSYKELIEITNKLCNASERDKKFGTLVSGMMLQLLEIANGNVAEDLGDTIDENLEKVFPRILEKYRTQFKPRKIQRYNSMTAKSEDKSVHRSGIEISSSNVDTDCFITSGKEDSVNRKVIVPSKPIGQAYATCRRKKPMVEQVKNKYIQSSKTSKVVSIHNLHTSKANLLKPKGTKTSSCGFCGDCSHRITRCGKKKALGKEQDGSLLAAYLLNSAPFSLLNKNESRELIVHDMSSRSGVRHMVVHSLHSKWNCDISTRPTQNDLSARITFLNQYGEPLGGYNRCLVDLIRVLEYIYANKNKKGRYIFSTLHEESIGPQFHCSQTDRVSPRKEMKSANGLDSTNSANSLCSPVRNPYEKQTEKSLVSERKLTSDDRTGESNQSMRNPYKTKTTQVLTQKEVIEIPEVTKEVMEI